MSKEREHRYCEGQNDTEQVSTFQLGEGNAANIKEIELDERRRGDAGDCQDTFTQESAQDDQPLSPDPRIKGKGRAAKTDSEEGRSNEGKSQLQGSHTSEQKPILKAKRCSKCTDIDKKMVLKGSLFALLALGLLATVITLFTHYMTRQPRIQSTENRVMSTSTFQEVRRVFFDLSEPRFLGKWTNEPGVAVIVEQTGYYNPNDGKFLEKAEDVSDEQFTWGPWGSIDLFDKEKGVYLRALNLQNYLLYIDIEKITTWFNKPHTDQSRLLSSDSASRNLADASTEKKTYMIESVKEEVAKLLGLPTARIVVEEEIFWTGVELENGKYEIEKSYEKRQESSSDSPFTAAQLKNNAQKLVKEAIMPTVEQKINSIQDNGVLIGKMLGFGFDRFTDLFLKYEVQTTINIGNDNRLLQEKKEEVVVDDHEDEGDDDEEDESVDEELIAKYTPKPPVIITNALKPLLPMRPSRVRDGKTVTEETYQSIVNCIHYQKKVMECSTAEWSNPESPYVRTEESISDQAYYVPRTRLRVSITHLPDEDVVQEPYQVYNPEEAQENTSENEDQVKPTPANEDPQN